jgi:hypothetical protein
MSKATKSSLTIAIFLTVIGITSAYTLEELRRNPKRLTTSSKNAGTNIPFGTILGLFTISVLLRESVKALFAAMQTSI